MMKMPLTDKELLEMLNGGESDRVEFKENFEKNEVRKKVRETVCAFANDLAGRNMPGFIFIGVNDKGEPSNLAIDEELLNTLAHIKTDGNILPLPALSVQKCQLKGADVAVIIVMPSDMPPLRYDGRIWVRTGARQMIASEQDERILNEKRRYKQIPFDLYPVPSATINDLSRVAFEAEYLPQAFAEDMLEANHRTYEQRLVSCGMIYSIESKIPTITGLLALGKSPQDFLPGAYIQFLRIDGAELSDDVIDAEEIRGTIVHMLRRAEEKLQAHNRRAVDIMSAPTHKITMLYPEAALQQVLYNAIMHRTYEGTNAPVRIYWFNDRVEIHSPGGPYGNVTKDSFGTPGINDYRNPNIAAILKTFGFVQKYGIGIYIARKAMKDNGNPPPDYEVSASLVLATLRIAS